MSIWVEKYRPKEFKDVLGLANDFPKLVNQSMPHLLFTGSSGIGKTTVAKIVIKELQAESLVLNSSLDRKIETIRERVVDFAKTKALNDKIKIIFLDEADGLLSPVQEALRNLMETYAKNVRFILTCNNESKIIAALKSRCTLVKFENVNKDDLVICLDTITKKENIKYGHNALHTIVEKFYPDVRAMINILQQFSKVDIITKEMINNIDTIYNQIATAIKSKDLMQVRKVLKDNAVDPEQMFSEMYIKLMESDLTQEKKERINTLAMQCNYYSAGAAFKEISLEAFCYGLFKIL